MHLKEFGYEYIVADIEWYSNDAGTKRKEFQYIPFGDDVMDEFGRFQPSPGRFPSSTDGSGFTHLLLIVIKCKCDRRRIFRKRKGTNYLIV